MVDASFQRGDRVRHAKRPEWGVGVVDRCETVTQQGRTAQRIVVTFEHHGRVTLDTAYAEIVPASEYAPAAGNAREGGWLGSLREGRDEDRLADLPDAATDPFTSLSRRLDATLDLYRFGEQPRHLIEWAVAQTGLSDPMSEYPRDALESAYRKFATRRDGHLRQLVAALRKAGEEQALQGALQRASGPAREALRRAMR